MKIAIACDHAGLPLRDTVANALRAANHEVIDLGTHSPAPVDYPDFARKLGRAVVAGEAERGVLLCGSGAGASIAANKVHGIRAGLAHDTYTAHQMVEHDDVNVLCLGARVIGVELAAEIVRVFVSARFTAEERHLRRVGKIADIESLGR